MDIKNVLLKRTCIACPEQYEIWYDGKYIGWFKLRWGIFKLMNYESVEICRHDFNEEYKGSFADPVERFNYLTKFLDDNFIKLIGDLNDIN